jgi:TRAP transporter TAXI family solute receptor
MKEKKFMTVKPASIIKYGTIAALFLSANAISAQELITIGSSSATGNYYATGSTICKLINLDRKDHDIRCAVESTGGSLYNVGGLRDNELEFAIIQSNWQQHAFSGTSQFTEQGPTPKLRSMFSLYAQPLNLIARSDSKIVSLQDLPGKRINLGEAGSDDRDMMQTVLQSMGWSESDFATAAELRKSEAEQALCANQLDAIAYIGAHPNNSIKSLSYKCDIKLIPVSSAEIDQVVNDNPYYTYSVLSKDSYPGTTAEVENFGVMATLVTSSDVSDDIAYNVTKAVFEHFEEFKRSNPVLADLHKEDMVTNGLTIPLHPGAAKYYREVGLLK